MATPRSYTVTVTHPTDYHKGDHTITVYNAYNGGVYLSGEAFGCSRDYQVKDDKTAISAFLAEHACRVVKVAKVK